MIKIVIIEDERLTARDLADTLEQLDPEIEVVAILPSIGIAVNYLEQNHDYHLIFSDVQLSDGLSFEIFQRIQINVPVIFCTAYDQYALDAFRTNGIDYLLKPFNKASVSRAIDKYLKLKSNFDSKYQQYDKVIQNIQQQIVQQSTSILVYVGDKIIPLEVVKIALFALEYDRILAYTFEGKKFPVSLSLDELEDKCGNLFFRTDRQHLINRKAIRDATVYFNRKLRINLSIEKEEPLFVGKLKKTAFLEWLTLN